MDERLVFNWVVRDRNLSLPTSVEEKVTVLEGIKQVFLSFMD